MEYLIGAGLAVVVCGLALVAGFDLDRVFYPTMLIVVAHYYILFAVMGGSTWALATDAAGAVVFLALAVAGFKKNLWLAAGGLAGHGVFDLFHGLFFDNPGVPAWWPGFCCAFDVLAGGFLAMLLLWRPSFCALPEPSRRA